MLVFGGCGQTNEDFGEKDKYRGFLLDNVLHSETEGEIHYNVYIPDSYDGSRPFALFFTLPGYEGLYFQGVGANLRAEQFGFTAQDYEPVVKARIPVCLVIGEDDEYYGSEPSEEAYDRLYEGYKQEGLSEEEIEELLVLDVKDSSYFESQGITDQHGKGGALFSNDEEIMGWLFGK